MLRISVSDLKESNLFLNDAFRTLFYKQEDQLLKELCGNAMGCVFVEDKGTGCGSTSNCKNCVLRECILKSFTEKVPVYKQRMTRKMEQHNEELLSILKTRVKEYSQLRQQLSSEKVFSDVMRQEQYRSYSTARPQQNSARSTDFPSSPTKIRSICTYSRQRC